MDFHVSDSTVWVKLSPHPDPLFQSLRDCFRVSDDCSQRTRATSRNDSISAAFAASVASASLCKCGSFVSSFCGASCFCRSSTEGSDRFAGFDAFDDAAAFVGAEMESLREVFWVHWGAIVLRTGTTRRDWKGASGWGKQAHTVESDTWKNGVHLDSYPPVNK